MNYSLALRLVVGWTYFSAFWRRMVLDYKLDPEVAGYIGEKFNHFLPHALFIKPQIEQLLLHPEALWWVMFVFTIVEGVVGLAFMLGIFTRIMSLAVTGLALGILLSAGWIGTTCLDEWQIGILGMAGGLTILFTGGGKESLDHKLSHLPLIKKLSFDFLAAPQWHRLFIGASFAMLFITLGTNQIFHGGVWGTLHNKSVRPKLELTNAKTSEDTIEFDLQRTEGADVYGSFLYRLEVKDLVDGKVLKSVTADEWTRLENMEINNYYVAKIRPGKLSLIIPLGAKARIKLPIKKMGPMEVILTDISGQQWKMTL